MLLEEQIIVPRREFRSQIDISDLMKNTQMLGPEESKDPFVESQNPSKVSQIEQMSEN